MTDYRFATFSTMPFITNNEEDAELIDLFLAYCMSVDDDLESPVLRIRIPPDDEEEDEDYEPVTPPRNQGPLNPEDDYDDDDYTSLNPEDDYD